MNQLLQHSGTCDHGTSEHRTSGADQVGDCATEPRELTYPRARAILYAHDRHLSCRQWIAAAAYLSAGLDDE
ncbi:hypothetical protein A5780_17715 [Nocardia sp. 852002-20019_SCH5090214]|jgi:hypothetical protein|uniref:Uncharacterized protein n=2 Tax=Nocardia TaxID=1817 RepID=A0A2S5ZZT1_9NOCA|nr:MULTISPECIES: hypothetical protein [Nocardia]OBF82314.1 hypothetical protein A9X06_19435 [Mycobacterium sp. 852002-51759_SCH5129042]MBF6149476.1 hypothetical protein [Nocardia nova]MBF6277895.1 hypothetical protein [Nocardia nova]MBV7707499.1 hypothetical protein [Nocardia nova]MDN2498445.1 hypothetical protein [Nocardia nova]